MDLPEEMVTKLDVYTLFCRQLLNRLPALEEAMRTDSRLTCEGCCRSFDDELRIFFQNARPRNLQEDAELFADRVRTFANLIRSYSPKPAEVFQEMVDSVLEISFSGSWHYQDDLEALHQQGRQLALRFYEDSPWSVTHERMAHEVSLKVYSEARARIAYNPIEECIKLSPGDDLRFSSYLAYPFNLMHEYVAHIIALDYNYNEPFNDGWLLHAADAFLYAQGRDLGLDARQISAFGDSVYPTLNLIARRACEFTREFERWLRDDSRFRAWTWELAAFEPAGNRDVSWPTQVMNRLQQAYLTDRETLRCKIEMVFDLRALFEMLPLE